MNVDGLVEQDPAHVGKGLEGADDISVSTLEAVEALSRFDVVLASLRKAGVPDDEVDAFEQNVRRQASSRFGLSGAAAGAETGSIADLAAVLLEGPMEHLVRGTYGFAAVWKPAWGRLEQGVFTLFRGAKQPGAVSQGASHPSVVLPLADDAAAVPEPASEPLRRRLGREYILTVRGAAAGTGCARRTVTIALSDAMVLAHWEEILRVAQTRGPDADLTAEDGEERTGAQDGSQGGGGIHYACQTGNARRVAALLRHGVSVNRENAYGCVPLHCAVRRAVQCAVTAASGSASGSADATEARAAAQEALSVLVLLMSRGADARAQDNVGETPLALAKRLAQRLPKARRLLEGILDASRYEASGAALYVKADEKMLQAAVGRASADPNHWLEAPPPAPIASGGLNFARTAHTRSHVAARRAATAAAAPGYGREHTAELESIGGNSLETFHGVPVSRFWGMDVKRRCARPGLQAPNLLSSRPVTAAAAVPISAHYGHFEPQRRAATAEPARSRRVQSKQAHKGAREGAVGVMFRDYRFARKHQVVTPTVKLADAGRRRPATSPHVCRATMRSQTASPAKNGSRKDRRGGAPLQQQQRPCTAAATFQTSNGTPALDKSSSRPQRTERNATARPSTTGSLPPGMVSDAKARQLIRQWAAHSARTSKRLEGQVTESSRFVAFGTREEVACALRLIRDATIVASAAAAGTAPPPKEGSAGGKGRGDLIPLDALCQLLRIQGEPLTPQELADFCMEADPTGSGYIGCTRLAEAISAGRLPPLKDPRKAFNEEDDVVGQKKRARKAAELRRQQATPAGTFGRR